MKCTLYACRSILLLASGYFISTFVHSQTDVGSKTCLYFDGVDDYISTSYVTNFGVGTIEMWIKPYSNGVLAGKNGNTNCNDVVFSIVGGMLQCIMTNSNCSQTAITTITGATTLTWGVWYHVAMTWSNVTPLGTKLYLNGNLDASQGASRTMTSNAPLWMGTGSYNGNYAGTYYPNGTYFKGYMDEVRFWGGTTAAAARTQDSIRAYMHRRIPSSYANLKQYWRFDDATGTTAANSATGGVAGTLIDGTVTGPTWQISSAPFADGNSNKQIIATAATYTFTTTDLAMNVTATSGSNTFVVTECKNPPEGIQPDSSTYTQLTPKYYWVVNKYGSATITTDLIFTLGAGTVTAAEETTPGNLTLLSRSSNDYLCWNIVSTASSAIEATGVVTFTGISNFSHFIIVRTNNIVVPVELLSFTGKKDRNTVLLNWETATEINNDYFTIERANSQPHLNPPHQGGLEFVPIGTVKGAGNSSITRNYEFTDPLPNGEGWGGALFYRLKQTDFDGKFEYSNTIAVALELDADAVIIYPNPASDFIEVHFNSGVSDDNVIIELYNVVGKKVLSNKMSELNTGAQNISGNTPINVHDLSGGVYYMKININGECRHVGKITVL